MIFLFILIVFLIIVPLIVVGIVANWKLFKKTGRDGWKSLIPIYSSWVLIEISGLNWWWFLLLVINFTFSYQIEELTFAINICSFLAIFNCYYNIARKFGRDKTTSIFAGIFPFIFVLIFAFSNDIVFDTDIPVSVNGIFGTPVNNMGNSNDNVGSDIDNLQKYSYCGNCGLKLDNSARFCPNCGRKK